MQRRLPCLPALRVPSTSSSSQGRATGHGCSDTVARKIRCCFISFSSTDPEYTLFWPPDLYSVPPVDEIETRKARTHFDYCIRLMLVYWFGSPSYLYLFIYFSAVKVLHPNWYLCHPEEGPARAPGWEKTDLEDCSCFNIISSLNMCVIK